MSEASRPATAIVRIAERAADRAGAVAVRRRVFVEEQRVPEEIEMDDRDGTAIHLVAILDGSVVGTARFYPADGSPVDGGVVGHSWRIGRVAVLSEYRRCGLGRRLMETAAVEIEDLGGREIEIHAQTAAIGFYRSLGYHPEGEPFLEAGIEHQQMRRLSSLPDAS